MPFASSVVTVFPNFALGPTVFFTYKLEKVQYSIVVSLLGATEVAWYKGDEVIKETFDDFKFDHEGELHRLTIAEVFPEDSGVYKAEGSNATGANSSQFTILVNGELFTTITVLSCSMNSSSGVLLIIDTRCQLVNDVHARLSISIQPDFHNVEETKKQTTRFPCSK